jgi:hypothetical protein
MARRLLRDTDAEIKRLVDENAALLAKIEARDAELEARDAELASYHFAKTRWAFLPADYPQPTPAELVLIRRVAMARGRALNPQYFRRSGDEMDPVSIRAFESGFAACATMRRSEALDTKYGVQMLADAVSDRAKAMSLSGFSDIGIGILILAVIAQNDVAFLAPDRAPHDLAFGLRIGDGPGARSSGEGWKSLLAGKYLTPIPLPPLKQEIRSQARVRDVMGNVAR